MAFPAGVPCVWSDGYSSQKQTATHIHKDIPAHQPVAAQQRKGASMKPKRRLKRSSKRTSPRQRKQTPTARRLAVRRRRSPTKRGRRAVKRPLKRTTRERPSKARRAKRPSQRPRGRTVRRLKLPTRKGLRGFAVTGRKDRSLGGRYWNAVDKYATRGDTSALLPFENAFVTDIHGRRIWLLTDIRILDQLAAAGVLSFESIYGRRI
jgi:hypothetical protein